MNSRRRVNYDVMPLTPMYAWRITKYDPAFRDEGGAYLKYDWTSVSDIGKSFDGDVLTPTQYCRVENAYIETAMSFVADAGLDAVTVTYVENHGTRIQQSSDLPSIRLDPALIVTGMLVTGDALADACRLTLREKVWCKLGAPNGFYLHFGYDYYMYVGSPAASLNSIAVGKAQGLFIEPMLSPYLDEA